MLTGVGKDQPTRLLLKKKSREDLPPIQTMKNILKTLTLAPVIAGSIALAPAPAEAFWGPSPEKVCRENLSFVEEARQGIFDQYGLGTAHFTGRVSSAKVNPSVPHLGYEQVTGCVTQYKHMGQTWIQPYNIELDHSGQQYYASIGQAIPVQ